MIQYIKCKKIHKKLDKIRTYAPTIQVNIVSDIFELVKKSDQPDLFDDNIYRFPCFTKKKYWYSEDADFWLLYNGLPFAKKTLLHNLLKYNLPD